MELPAIDREFPGHFDTRIAALVLNLSAYPFHQSSLGITRSLGRVGIPVFAVMRDSFIPSGASRYLAGKFLWRPDVQTSEWFLEGMTRIGKILDGPTILVPADDLSAILIAEHADELASRFIFARPPATLPRILANKRHLYELCHRLGIACPHTVSPHSRAELLDVTAHMQFPVVVKATEPWLLPRGVKSTAIVSSRHEIIDYFENFWRNAPDTSLIIQKMIPASCSEDWFVHGYCDQQSNPNAIFTGIKLRSYPAFAGPTTLARSVRNDALQQQATKLLSDIGYRGIMDLDYRLDKRDGSYNLLDFNPRIGAQFRVFEDRGGVDVVRALHLDLTGRGIRSGPQIEGRGFISEVHDLLASFSYHRGGDLSMKEWFFSLRGVEERAWWASDDVLPFLFMCLWMPYRAASRVLGLGGNATREEPQPRLVSSWRPRSAQYSPQVDRLY
ncbi:MAG: carboxylate--amine ligase [Terriglobia bacterium]